MEKIILASASPRRRELMTRAGLDFEVRVADIEEKIPEGTKPYNAVKELALQKAQTVAADNPDRVIIAADTVVALNDIILGKPSDERNAVEMLNALSGKTHKVYTGVAIVGQGRTENFFEETEVEFFTLTDYEIKKYVETGEPMDKAGAYGIQGKGCMLVKKINGDYFNVVGLPIAKVYRKLSDFNV